MKTMRLAGLIVMTTLIWCLAGCATEHKSTTYTLNQDGSTNSVALNERNRTDPLAGKQVIQQSDFWGVDLNIMGNNYMSPAKVKIGHGKEIWITNPTGLTPVYAAPLATANGGSQSWFQQNDTAEVSSIPGQFPTNTNTATADNTNPLTTGSFGSSPVSVTSTNKP